MHETFGFFQFKFIFITNGPFLFHYVLQKMSFINSCTKPLALGFHHLGFPFIYEIIPRVINFWFILMIGLILFFFFFYREFQFIKSALNDNSLSSDQNTKSVFWCGLRLNSRFFIQPLGTLSVKLTGIYGLIPYILIILSL